MKIYTRTGDEGQTSLIGGARVGKDNPRIRACGDIDEVNSAVGIARSFAADDGLAEVAEILQSIQRHLFDLGAEVASPDARQQRISEEQITWQERLMDRFTEELPALKHFILPGGGPAGVWLHQCRSVCRRAERAVVSLGATDPVRPEVYRYINRLSDLFFVLARLASHRGGHPEVLWEG